MHYPCFMVSVSQQPRYCLLFLACGYLCTLPLCIIALCLKCVTTRMRQLHLAPIPFYQDMLSTRTPIIFIAFAIFLQALKNYGMKHAVFGCKNLVFAYLKDMGSLKHLPCFQPIQQCNIKREPLDDCCPIFVMNY